MDIKEFIAKVGARHPALVKAFDQRGRAVDLFWDKLAAVLLEVG